VYCPELLWIMISIAAKLTNAKPAADGIDWTARLDWLMSSGSVSEDLMGDSPSVDRFRKSCLLTWYEFHQFPGYQPWLRAGKLARLALRWGLDQIENYQGYSGESLAASEEEVEEWRLIWWAIYRMDSYANNSSGTPFAIDERCVYTALASEPVEHLRPRQDDRPKLCLPSKPENLWKLASSVLADPDTANFNLHILTTTVFRQAGQVLRNREILPHDEAQEQLEEVDKSFSSLRLALPARYMDPNHNAFWNESSFDYHQRLANILHLHMTQMIISVVNCFGREDPQDMLNWQRVLGCCHEIATIAEKWDHSMSAKIDPAICFILFTALAFLDLHKKSAIALGSHAQSTIDHCQAVLLQQLDGFAQGWTLAKLLTRKYRHTQENRVAG
jgi:hypothetical protein